MNLAVSTLNFIRSSSETSKSTSQIGRGSYLMYNMEQFSREHVINFAR